MLKIVNSPGKALHNIHKFESELRHHELVDRLAYARSWYAVKDATGEWHFGPSKFIGYENIDAKTYLAAAEESDGRRTEAQLQMYFRVVDPGTELYEELSAALFALLAKYGKTPSTKMRISVLRERRRLAEAREPSAEETNDAVVNLMVGVARTLPTAHFQKLRTQLNDIWS